MNSSVKGKEERIRKKLHAYKEQWSFSFFRERSKHNLSIFRATGSLPELHLPVALERVGQTEERYWLFDL